MVSAMCGQVPLFVTPNHEGVGLDRPQCGFDAGVTIAFQAFVSER